ncbi:PepSY-associated TM helix domain-containing protein [Pelagicoccus albus]|uniref:PepSY domain-containing protein n=1 Tax=Pelagicoccus albus TaxID=415222 RepID=A0A7X1B8Y6_9BACT|nr:PepSY domain-containing protein [Pelagicoccus albus]MBC2607853.1 PepSY domain-containing protein [Pelagicoccus albus]
MKTEALNSQGTKKQNVSGKIYQAVWRWHFWAGLISAPFLIIMSLTGAIYVFEDELAPIFHPELYLVEPAENTVSLERIRSDLAIELPDHELHNFHFPENKSRSWSALVEEENKSGEHEFRRVFYDQYRGQILGHVSTKEGFFPVVLRIHRTFLAGETGRYLAEVSTCWGIVSILAGLYLWWPRKKEKVKGVWIPRTKGSFRTILRDWHTVPGMYVSLFVLLIMLTGLLFTNVWGRAYMIGNALSGGFPEFYISPPKSADAPEGVKQISPDKALSIAKAAYPNFGATDFTLDLPHPGTNDAFSVLGDITRPFEDIGAVFIDQHTGEILLSTSSESFPLPTHLTLLFYPIHTGSIFGLGTKVLAVLSCLLITAMSATGVWIWWRRRPQGKLGAPRRPVGNEVPRWIAWFTIALAIFLPTVGATLLLIGLASWVKRKAG